MVSGRDAAWNAAWGAAGLLLGTANSIRHRLTGYRTPRPFGASDIERNIAYVCGVVDRWVRSGLEPQGRRILELGPGPDLGTGLVLISLGAASYTAIDRYPLVHSARQAFNGRLARALGLDLAAAMEQIAYRVATIPGSADTLGPFDAFVSNASMEHVPDVAATLHWMAERAAPGAQHVHVVDSQTHMRWVRRRDPWNILRYPDAVYSRLLAYPGSPNRWLASDFAAAGASAGITLQVLPDSRAEPTYVRRVRSSLSGDFRARGDEDLSYLSFVLVGVQESPLEGPRG